MPAQVQESLVQRKGTDLWGWETGPLSSPISKGRVGPDQGTLVDGIRQVTQGERGQVGNVTPQRACALCQPDVTWPELGTDCCYIIWFCRRSWKPRFLKCEVFCILSVGN